MPSLNPDTSSKEAIHSEIDEQGMVENDNLPIVSISNNSSKSLPIPYKAIFTSLPVYGLLIANIAQGYGFYTLLSEIPTYMSQILHFDIKEVCFFCIICSRRSHLLKVVQGLTFESFYLSECFFISCSIPLHVDLCYF